MPPLQLPSLGKSIDLTNSLSLAGFIPARYASTILMAYRLLNQLLSAIIK
jgi:hypothetical protein